MVRGGHMANWCNIWLVVFGPSDELLAFRRDAGRLKGRVDATKSKVFLPEMEFGEGGDLTACAPRAFGRRFQRATYTLQGRNDDHVDHFREISGRYPGLAFILAYSDPNADDHGSYLLVRGRARTWRVPNRLRHELMLRQYRRFKMIDARGRMDYDGEDSDLAEWIAFGDMMNAGVARWEPIVLKWLRVHHPPKRAGRRT